MSKHAEGHNCGLAGNSEWFLVSDTQLCVGVLDNKSLMTPEPHFSWSRAQLLKLTLFPLLGQKRCSPWNGWHEPVSLDCYFQMILVF